MTQKLSSDEIASLFGAEDLAGLAGGHFNLAPTQTVLILQEEGERRVVTAQRWGLIPPWADGPTRASALINARAETVTEKPSFRVAFKRQRCIVPVDGFYEWQKVGAAKVPHAVVRRDGKPLALAGLWSAWRDPATGDERRSFAIVTTRANETMRPIHERMPVILPDDAWDAWLDPTFQDVAALRGVLAPAPDDLLRAYPVSGRVNDVRNDGPELLRPME
jgi:putative SOS response-associated peptidase YedK